MVETLERIRTGNFVDPGATTLADYLDEWLKAVEPMLRITTWRSYEQMLRLWVIPRVGRTKLADLTPLHLRRLQADLLKNGKVDGSALSHQSVANCRRALKKALSDAVKWGLLSNNPMTFVDAPRVIAVSRPTWDATQAKAFLDVAADNELIAAWVLFLTTGMRRGEVAGLRWDAVDLDKASLAVRINRVSAGQGNRVAEHPPKTKRGQRSIALDLGTIETLRAHRRLQLEDRLRAGPAWTDTGFVFCGLDGLPLHPDTFTATFKRLRDPLPLPAITLHDLRHTSATLALAAGVHPKVVSERLGHANISITLDLYSHVIEDMQSEAAEQIGALLFGSTAGTS